MTASEMISAIEVAGGALWAADGELKCRLPESAIWLVAELRDRKPEFLALLSTSSSVSRTAFPAEPTRTSPEVRAGMSIHDPKMWEPEFDTWANTRCVFRDRHLGGIGSLHIHFCEWCDTHGSVPCTRKIFEVLLRDQGFEAAGGMVYGLILKDWELG